MGESAQENLQAKQQAAPENTEQIKDRIRDDLFAISTISKDNQELIAQVSNKLASLGKEIDKLKAEYPPDEEINQLIAYHKDLTDDLKEGRELHIDSSFDQILSEMQTEVQKSGVRIEKPDQTIISETVQKLKAIGINPSYIVTKGDKNAKTVVYFMQIHGNPGLSDEALEKMGVKKSQQQIFEAIGAGVKNGLIKTFYGEGVPGNQSMPDLVSKSPALAAMAEYKAKHELGDQIDIVGMENMDLLGDTIKSMIKGSDDKGAYHRMSAQNVVLADYVTENLKQSDQSIAFMSLGAGHEKIFVPDIQKQHPLPISETLAYNDVNVVVVDAATPYLNLGAMNKHELENVRKAISGKK